MEDFFLNMGFWGLFLASFLAATVIPFSSEAVLSVMLINGFPPAACLTAATAGNWLGGLTTYGLGYLGKEEWLIKYFGIKEDKLLRFKTRLAGKTKWIAFMAWLPFIGDIIAAALGLLKANPWTSALWMLIGKCARYAVWGFLTLKAMGI